jgi:copper chaperone
MMKTTIMNIEGMSCQHCVQSVTDAIKKLQGVSEVDVNLESKTATVKYDESVLSTSDLSTAVENQGFDVV